jgi:putative protein kinase ArgK-like GTPase of G3E family
MWQIYFINCTGDIKALARSISFVENEQPGYETLLQSLSSSHTKIIGITGRRVLAKVQWLMR